MQAEPWMNSTPVTTTRTQLQIAESELRRWAALKRQAETDLIEYERQWKVAIERVESLELVK